MSPALVSAPEASGPPALRASGAAEGPLSIAQESRWKSSRLPSARPPSNLAAVRRLEGDLDDLAVGALQRSLAEIVRRHGALRTRIVEMNGEARQVVDAAVPVPLPLVDLSALLTSSGGDRSAREREVERLLAQEVGRPFDPVRGPVFRFRLLRDSRRDHTLAVVIDPLVADAASLRILERELAALYGAFVQGLPSPLPELPLQYVDYALWQRGWLRGPMLEAQLGFWRAELAGAPALLALPTDRSRPAVRAHRGARLACALPADAAAAVRALERRAGATPFMVLLAALQVLLHRYCGADDVLVGSPIENRDPAQVAGLIGPFANTLVHRQRLQTGETFLTLLERVRAAACAVCGHPDLPVGWLAEALGIERSLGQAPLFQVVLEVREAATELPSPWLARSPAPGTAAGLDLALSLSVADGEIAGTLEHAADLYDRATALRLLLHLSSLLTSAAADPGRRLADLRLLTAAERHQVLGEWNDTAADLGPASEACLHDLVAAQAARTPAAVAVVFAGEELTYRELDRRAGSLAWRLRALGVRPESLVGIAARRSLELVVGLLAILKAGGAYVPFDPDYPEERLAYMLEDSGVAVLLTQEELAGRLAALAPRVRQIAVDGAGPEGSGGEPPAAGVRPDNAAYAIYTSGSTGRPKGAVNTHRAIVNRLLWMQQAYGLTAADRVLQKTPFSFDVSVWELFWPLLVGARLVVARPEGHRDGAYLVDLIAREDVTTLHFVPSMLQVFLQQPGLDRLGSVRRVMASGEALTPELERRFMDLLGGPLGIALHNLYGPTEAAVDVTSWPCGREPWRRTVPIGRPIANLRIHLLDRQGELVPIGVAGEIHIGGTGLARGYLKRPDLTADRFVPDPTAAAPGARLYRTGDLGRHLPGGESEYLGRIDHQVKIRGFRIELGEIENALARHPAVREAVVLSREDVPGEPCLVAYYTPRTGVGSGRGELRTFLARSLPDHMLPASYVRLDALPLTPSGKVDRKALPAPRRERPDLAEAPVAPRTPSERALVGIWAAAVGFDEIGVRDDFFALGGHSLLALRVVTGIRERFGVELPLSVLFRAPTVERMAALLAEPAGGPSAHAVLMAGAGAPGPPLFCVHGVGGHIFRLVHLAQRLGAERPFYGIQGWADLDDVSHLGSVEAMAQRYLADVRRVQPEGPYRLAGYSMGGVVAFEMARSLTAAGESVAWLGMIDAAVPKPPEPLAAGKFVSFEAGLAAELGYTVDIELLREMRPEERLSHVVTEGLRLGVLPGGFTEADARRYIQVFYASFAAFQRFVPHRWAGRIAVFRTAAEAATNPDPTLGWSALAAGGVEVHDVPGDHITMVLAPHVDLLAGQIAASLAGSGAAAPSPASRRGDRTMNAEALLSPRAEELLLPGPFRTIGRPALLVTNERTPAGFHDGVRATAAPDGWIFGPGCGNVLAMVEAFAATPRGLVLVDVDPAVVCAGRMLVGALRRHPDLEGFVAGVFCGGREPLAALEEEVIGAEPSASVRAALRGQRERLWQALSSLTESFSLRPADASRLIGEWAAHHPPAGQVVPVRTFLARNYARLRAMAVRGDIVVLCSTLFHPALLAAVAALPGWRGARNLVYLSNVADHALRRALMATARIRLGVAAAGTERTPRSSAEFVAALNAEQVGGLRALDTPGTVYVSSSAKNDLTLVAQAEIPVYRESDFELGFDLDRNAVRFFEAFSVPPAAADGLPQPWSEARPLRALVLRLYSAGVRGDERTAHALLAQLAAGMDRQPRGGDPLWSAFRLAEIGHVLLVLRRLPVAGALEPATAALRSLVAAAAAQVSAHAGSLRAGAAERPLQALLGALALTLAGELLGDGRRVAEGRSLLAAVPAPGRLAGAAAQAEALLRLTVWHIQRPEDGVADALTGTAAALLSAIGPDGDVASDTGPGRGDGYTGYLAGAAALFETVKLALLFYGLSAEEGMAIEAALLVDYKSRHRETMEAPDTDVLLGVSR